MMPHSNDRQIRDRLRGKRRGKQKLEDMDRQARGYGWEIGRGTKIEPMVQTSDDNPFLDPNWKETHGV